MPISKETRQKAADFWVALPDDQKWAIGDELVLGTFDWRDWMPKKPEAGLLRALDYERMLWEQSHG